MFTWNEQLTVNRSSHSLKSTDEITGPNGSQMTKEDICQNHRQSGTVKWIGLRTAHNVPPNVVEEATIDVDKGLVGDRFDGKPGGPRMVTLIQAEHIETIAKFLNVESVDPALLRRNIVVSGINLEAFQARNRDLTFKIGEAILQMTGPCDPCSLMERQLGEGGYNAMVGLGGICCSVVSGGQVKLGDQVELVRS